MRIGCVTASSNASQLKEPVQKGTSDNGGMHMQVQRNINAALVDVQKQTAKRWFFTCTNLAVRAFSNAAARATKGDEHMKGKRM